MSSADMEAYLGRVRALIWSVKDASPEVDIGNALHLVDHGEPPEGLHSLAWSVVNAGAVVTRETYDELIELIDGMVDPEHMPPDLEAFVDRS